MGSGAKCKVESNRRWLDKHPEYKVKPSDPKKREARIEYIESSINPCYLKEARAILEGKDVRGKNRCTKLPGD